MSHYDIIFFNNFFSRLLLVFDEEYSFEAAQIFGHYDMRLALLFAVIGSSTGLFIDFWVGRLVASTRRYWRNFDEDVYQRITFYSQRYGVFLLLLPLWYYPGIIAFAAGMTLIKPWKALAFILFGCCLHYLLAVNGA